jgi:hypothetical protein
METIAGRTDAAAESKADQATIAQFIAARDKLIELKADLAAEEAAIALNSDRYDEAARSHAAGADADPGSILADSDRRRHRIAGLQMLIGEQEAAFKALQGPNRIATSREGERLTAERIAALNKDIVVAEATANDAQASLDRTQAELRRLRFDLAEVEHSRQGHIRDHHGAMRAV